MTSGTSSAESLVNSTNLGNLSRNATGGATGGEPVVGIRGRVLPWAAQFILIILILVTQVTLANSASFGQSDLPEARAARNVLSGLGSRERELVNRHFEPLGFTVAELHRELLRGDAACSEVIRQAAEMAARLSSGGGEDEPLRVDGSQVTRSSAPSLTWGRDLAGRLEDLAEALNLPPPEVWRDLADQQARQIDTGPPVESPRDRSIDLEARLLQLEQAFSTGSAEFDAWRDYWLWDTARQFAVGNPVAGPDLDNLEQRWQATRLLWDEPLVLETALEMEGAIQQARARLFPESQRQRHEAWCAIRDLLAAGDWREEANWRKLRQQITFREQRGDIHPLTRSIRRQGVRNNLLLECGRAAFSAWLPWEIRQQYPIRGMFAGSWAEGTGELEGKLDLQFQSSPLTAKWLLQFSGRSRGWTRSWERRIRVTADATTDLSGTTRATWTPWRLSFEPPVVSSEAEVRFRQIDAPGTWLRRRLSQQRTLQRRQWAERDTRREAEMTLRSQFIELGEELTELEQRLAYQFGRGHWATSGRLVPEVRISSVPDLLTWQACYPSAAPGRLTTAPPWTSPCDGIRVSVAEAAIESYLTASWGGRVWRGESLVPEFSAWFGDPDSSPRDSEVSDLEVTFGESPFRIRLEEERIEISLQCQSLRLGGTKYPPLSVALVYEPHFDELTWSWRRLGTPQIHFEPEGSEERLVSGRQQTLRLVAQRRLSRILPETFQGDLPRWELSESKALRASVIRQQVASGWWQLEFEWTPVNGSDHDSP